MTTQNISMQRADEVINLQLKKPRSWNWELSTSKSSPYIALPTIKLYNSKGKLLVEARDNGMQRQSWHSSERKSTPEKTQINNGLGSQNSFSRHLKKCRSDIFEFSHKNNISNKYELINSTEKSPKENLKPLKSRTESSFPPTEFPIKQRQNNIRKNENNSNRLKKSKSDLFCCKEEGNVLRKNRSSRDLSQNVSSHKRPSSQRKPMNDDLFQRMMKYNEESIKRAIADGYRNFITPLVPEKEKITTNDDVAKLENRKKKTPRNYVKEEVTNYVMPNNHKSIEMQHFTHKRYTTRTCSAGTLIISEPSFRGLNRRRRQTKMSDEASTSDTKTGASCSFKRDNTLESLRDTIDKDQAKYIRQLSDYFNETCDAKEEQKDVNSNFKECRNLNNLLNCEPNCEYSDINCNYIVQEPETPDAESKNRKLSGAIIECIEKLKELQRLKRKVSDEQSDKKLRSSTVTENTLRHNRTGNDVQAFPDDREPCCFDRVNQKQINDPALARLVRRLSSDNAKMGANVSRHSSKGLHGRRSQSSGSICNGKGSRHASSSDSKFCGSLPNYLDDSTTCNNNHHDCEKPPLVDVERIPPLGDAAPLHWKFSDTQAVFCDQGYGSERSPEEEYPPSLPGHDMQCHHHMDSHSFTSFIKPESTFVVSLTKGSRGLGLSVTGGSDSGGSWPGLIRIKRLFPHQPAATCGLLNVGDLLLEVNGITLTGLTNYEALEVLRTTPSQVELKVCRPPPDVLSCVSPISEVPPPPPRRDPPNCLNLTPPPYQPTPEDDLYHGEFDITLTKIHGSLGFTLRKEDDSALGHYVRALVREPALSDGRIHAGDKIIAVNDVEISSMTHEQAVQYLRQAGDVVTLRLYRDAAQTPVSTLSPSETTPRTSFTKKAHLRPEALDMLNDIAMRKIVNHDSYLRNSPPNASPRKLRRQLCSSDASQVTDTCNKYLINDEQFHEGLFRNPSMPLEDEDAYNSLFSIDSDDGDRPNRPISLDLCNSKGTPVITRKPKFNFSLAHNAYELNNLDPEILDAPNLTYNLGNDVKSVEIESVENYPQEPVSMPHIPTDNPGFSYKNPAYQSAHPPCGNENLDTSNSDVACKNGDDKKMKKWKGVVLNTEDDKKKRTQVMKVENEYEILAIELNRGWNSRLGFSLQGAAGVTYVSAVHPDSVAARDGRLKPGDRLIKVNDESVENMSTGEIIDLLRIVRGPVCIIVSRCKSKQDCTRSNAAN